MKNIEQDTLIRIGKDYYLVNDDDTQTGTRHDVVNLTTGSETAIDTAKDKFTAVCKIPEAKLERMTSLAKLALTYQLASDYIEHSKKILSGIIKDPATISNVKNARDDSQTAVDKIGEYFKNEYKLNDAKEVFAYLSNAAKELEEKSKQSIRE